MDQDRFDVFVGLDVGKEHHHATALNSAGRRLHDKALPQDEAALREVFDKLTVHGSVLVIVDQPATIGALPVTVARAMGIEVAYLPGLAMRRIADLHPGNAKTDARDAFIIAAAGRTMPHALRRVGGDDDLIVRQPAQQASRPHEADALLLRLRKQLLGDLLLIDDLSRHRIDHLDGLGHCPSFRSGQSQIHRFTDSPVHSRQRVVFDVLGIVKGAGA